MAWSTDSCKHDKHAAGIKAALSINKNKRAQLRPVRTADGTGPSLEDAMLRTQLGEQEGRENPQENRSPSIVSFNFELTKFQD